MYPYELRTPRLDDNTETVTREYDSFKIAKDSELGIAIYSLNVAR